MRDAEEIVGGGGFPSEPRTADESDLAWEAKYPMREPTDEELDANYEAALDRFLERTATREESQ